MHALGLCVRLRKEALLALGSPLGVEQLVALLVSAPASMPPLQLLWSPKMPAAHAHTLATKPSITMALSVVPTIRSSYLLWDVHTQRQGGSALGHVETPSGCLTADCNPWATSAT